MADQLPSVPEETATGFLAPYPPSTFYRDSIRSVDTTQWRIRSTLFTQSSRGSSYSSSYSTSYSSGGLSSNISGSSSGASDFGIGELTEIAQKMVSHGYIQKMVQEFSGQDPHSVLEAWFFELDVPWVLQSRRERRGSQFHLQPQELVQRWIRSLTLILLTIKELVTAGHVTPAVARFGKASISAVLDSVDIFSRSVAAKLQAMLLMYICVSSASYDMNTLILFSSSEAQRVFSEIGHLLKRKENNLTEDIAGMITEAKVKAFPNVDESWAIDIAVEKGQVHTSVQFLVDCIVSMRKAHASSQDSSQRHNTGKLRDLISDTMGYLKNMLQKKSEMCLDPRLRYMFLLNNFNFVAQVCEPSISLGVEMLSVHHQGLELTPECEKHMDSYLEVSWGHVVSCLLTTKFSGLLRRQNSTSSVAKFQTEFHKTYYHQKFWKVPDPRLRSLLREAITKRVILAYRDYLKENPELEKHGSGGRSSPEFLEEMVGDLFEG